MNSGPPAGPARRSVLRTQTNPAPRRDYLVELTGRMDEGEPATLALRYVPDRLILDPNSFTSYVRALGEAAWPSLEHLAAAVAEDVANELVARWAQVAVTADPTADGFGHAILVEDRNPRWDNKALLERLRRF